MCCWCHFYLSHSETSGSTSSILPKFLFLFSFLFALTNCSFDCCCCRCRYLPHQEYYLCVVTALSTAQSAVRSTCNRQTTSPFRSCLPSKRTLHVVIIVLLSLHSPVSRPHKERTKKKTVKLNCGTCVFTRQTVCTRKTAAHRLLDFTWFTHKGELRLETCCNSYTYIPCCNKTHKTKNMSILAARYRKLHPHTL